jgi:hypothetical protein
MDKPTWIKQSSQHCAEETDVVIGENNVPERIGGILNSGTYDYFALYTGAIQAGSYNPQSGFSPSLDGASNKLPLLLELRIYNETQELKVIRSQIGREFKYRLASESDLSKADYFEETQYLDIDSETTKEYRAKGTKPPLDSKQFFMTGGGKISFPTGDRLKQIKIINYLSYDEETGNLQIPDFRIKSLRRTEVDYDKE